jgi:hypothetical protein
MTKHIRHQSTKKQAGKIIGQTIGDFFSGTVHQLTIRCKRPDMSLEIISTFKDTTPGVNGEVTFSEYIDEIDIA